LRTNIEAVAPVVWSSVGEEVHDELGQRYVKVRLGPSQDSALMAFNFFRIVGGIGAIPDAYRRPIFESHANNLIKAHFEANNFYKESGPARELLELGHEIPKDATTTYAKAVILSYVGNAYGYCWDADKPNREMLSRFTIDCVRATLHLLDNDKDILWL
jgi:hypothetical protein